MDTAQLRAFAHRDWQLKQQAKDSHWLTNDLEAEDTLRSVAHLRSFALAIRPDWPSEADRLEDLGIHQRVAQALRRVDLRH